MAFLKPSKNRIYRKNSPYKIYVSGSYYSDAEFTTPIISSDIVHDSTIEVDSSTIASYQHDQIDIQSSVLFIDTTWSENPKPPGVIYSELNTSLESDIDTILAGTPALGDLKTVAQKNRLREQYGSYTELQWYQKQLDDLGAAPDPDPSATLRAKLEAKITELGG